MMLPYISVIGCGVTTSVMAGRLTEKNGKFNYGVSCGVAVASTIASSISNSIIESNYENLIDRQKAQTTASYVQQLSDSELEAALIKFNLLDKVDNTNVKVL